MDGPELTCSTFADIAELTTTNTDNGDDDEYKCELCENTAMEAVELQCGHVFGKECITQYIAQRRSCPVCRAAASAVDLKESFTTRRRVDALLFACRRCGVEGMGVSQLQRHYSMCVRRPRDGNECPFALYGCNTFMVGGAGVARHLVDNTVTHELLMLKALDKTQGAIASDRANVKLLVCEEAKTHTSSLQDSMMRLELRMQKTEADKQALQRENLRLAQLLQEQGRAHEEGMMRMRNEMKDMKDVVSGLVRRQERQEGRGGDAYSEFTILKSSHEALTRDLKRTRVDTYDAVVRAAEERRLQVVESASKLTSSLHDQMAAIQMELNETTHHLIETLAQKQRQAIESTKTEQTRELQRVEEGVAAVRGLLNAVTAKREKVDPLLESRVNLIENEMEAIQTHNKGCTMALLNQRIREVGELSGEVQRRHGSVCAMIKGLKDTTKRVNENTHQIQHLAQHSHGCINHQLRGY